MKATDMAMLAGMGVVLVMAWRGMGSLLDLAKGAGQAVGQAVERQTTTWQSILEGTGAPIVPPTPEGYLPSNWVYDAGDVSWGVPAGMTPVEFCRQQGWVTEECKKIKPFWEDWYSALW